MSIGLSNRIWEEAESFIRSCYEELGKSPKETSQRLRSIKSAIEERGSYEHTFEELQHGARMAWRNSTRCIGRLFWESLQVIDERSAVNEEQMAEALLRHIDIATNEGKIRPVLTVFAPDVNGQPVRIWNHQLIRYAGYEQADGSVIGDPISVELTKLCESLGWTGEGTRFDVLPLVLSAGGTKPKVFEIPKELVLEVPLTHPELSGFDELNLKWYAVPMVADMRLEIGGISYTAAPFNGWYMGTEIGARNLADTNRYNLLPQVAELMGLDTTREATLWRDKALVELNVAVLESYKKQGVSIVDHHTAAQQFMRFEAKETERGRGITGDWTWLIPPISPAATPIFHRSFENRVEKPNFFYQERLY